MDLDEHGTFWTLNRPPPARSAKDPRPIGAIWWERPVIEGSILLEISQMTDSRPSRTITSRENILNEPERTPDASIHVREPAFFASSYAKASRYQADRRFH